MKNLADYINNGIYLKVDKENLDRMDFYPIHNYPIGTEVQTNEIGFLLDTEICFRLIVE